ncbi:MAG: cytochrome C [Sulfurimonas sp.]|nr:cytochrome C [Sulfurimonas sp.]
MQKVILALVISSVMALADQTTIQSTMSLMKQGMNQIQSGFMYTNQKDILQGIQIIENSNAIFKNVDVSTFIMHNNKIQVTKNVNANLSEDLKSLRKAVESHENSDATKFYGKVMNDCLSCHIIIRGW